MNLKLMLVLLALSVASTEGGLARFLTRGFVDNSCERALKTTVSSNCIGNSSCAAFINLHFPECSEEVDRVLAQNVYSSSDGQERLVCDSADPTQALACQYYCRLKHRLNGACPEIDNVPTCKCTGWAKEPSNQCLSEFFYDRTLVGHSARIVALAALPNGDLASASFDETIKIWDGCDGRLKLTMATPSTGIKSLTALRSGRLAVGSFDGSITIRDADDGALVASLKGHSSPVTALAELDSGLASGYHDGLVKVWNITSRSEIWSARVHSDQVTALVRAENGSLASASLDSNVTILDSRNGSIILTLGNSSSGVRGMINGKNGNLIIGFSNGTIRLWNPREGLGESILAGKFSALIALENDLLAAGSESSIKIWNLGSGQLRTIIPGRGDSLAVLKDGNLATGDERAVKVWNPRVGTLKEREFHISVHTLYSGGNILVVLDNGDLACKKYYSHARAGFVIIKPYALESSNRLLEHSSNLSEISNLVHLNNGYLASGHEDGMIVIWDPSDGQVKRLFHAHNSSIQALTVLLDGNLASVSQDVIRIWNNNGTLTHTISMHLTDKKWRWKYSLAVLKNGNLASASSNKIIQIWNPSDVSCKRTIAGHEKDVHCLAVLPTGELASASEDQTVKIWDASSATLKRNLEIMSGFPTSLAVLPNGYLACGTSKGEIAIWDPLEGILKRTISVPDTCWTDQAVLSLAVLHDGSLAGATPCGIHIWSLH